MSGTDLDEAKKKIEDLQNIIAEEKYDYLRNEEMRVTLSVGIAAYPRQGEKVHDVLKAADQVFYKAKEKGKNCIEVMD
jgi:diguanylate cyclase (GGDEF)-like protein